MTPTNGSIWNYLKCAQDDVDWTLRSPPPLPFIIHVSGWNAFWIYLQLKVTQHFKPHKWWRGEEKNLIFEPCLYCQRHRRQNPSIWQEVALYNKADMLQFHCHVPVMLDRIKETTSPLIYMVSARRWNWSNQTFVWYWKKKEMHRWGL